jgi:hypothetical protein
MPSVKNTIIPFMAKVNWCKFQALVFVILHCAYLTGYMLDSYKH